MKISIKDFKGMVPKISSRSLPDRHGQVARNCRLQSNDFEPYRGVSNVLTLGKAGPVNTIFPIDRRGTSGGPYWLHWNDAEAPTGVEVARGFAKDDNATERVYFTGLDAPRVTNLALAAGGVGTSYPDDSWLMGVPIPTTTLVVDSNLSGALTPEYEFDGDDLGQFVVGEGDGGSVTNSGGQILLSTEGQNPSTATISNALSLNNFSRFLVSMKLQAITANANTLSAWEIDIGKGDVGPNKSRSYLLITHNSSNDELKVIRYPSFLGDGNDMAYISTGSLITSAITYGTEFRIELEYIFDSVQTNSYGTFNSYKSYLRIYDGANALVYTSPDPAFANILASGIFTVGAPTQLTGAVVIVAGVNEVGVDEIKISVAGSFSEASLTNYVYTFVNSFGEEGPSSPASENVLAGQDLTVTVSGFSVAGVDPDYGIIGYRLYRAVTGTSTTEYQLVLTSDYTTVSGIVDVLPIATTTTDDNNLDEDLQSVLISQEWIGPPEDARNIVALPNGIMVVSSGNLVCPSAQFRPHAYPEAYKLPTDFPIIAMGPVETSVVVMTEVSTYLVTGSDPSAMSMNLISSVYTCVSRRSVARWREYGVVYACKQGLVAITANGADLLTEKYITDREWASYNPETMQGVVYEDIYYGFYTDDEDDLQCITFDLRDGGIGFIDLDLASTASFVEPLTETLYVVQNGNQLKTWNTGSLLQATWESKLYIISYPTSFQFCQVKGRDPDDFLNSTSVTVNFYANKSGVPFFSKIVDDDLEFILPSTVCRELEVELVGDARVNQIEIATDVEELT